MLSLSTHLSHSLALVGRHLSIAAEQRKQRKHKNGLKLPWRQPKSHAATTVRYESVLLPGLCAAVSELRIEVKSDCDFQDWSGKNGLQRGH